jgi:small subunit ribosomal protein S7
MPRRREVPKREILPDPKFGSVDVSKFVNVLMEAGKKSVAERIIYGAFDQIQTKSGKDPLEVFNLAINNIKPIVEVRMALSMRWLRDASRKRSEKSMGQRLAGELLEASEGRGAAMKKREEVHRMAEANKAFSHFRF